jgi:hypothetical protein
LSLPGRQAGLEANIGPEIFIVLESRSVRTQVVVYRDLKGPHEGEKKGNEVEEDRCGGISW